MKARSKSIMVKMKKRKNDQNQIGRISARETEVKITMEKMKTTMTFEISEDEDGKDK
jgi:hypothetical protein